MKPADDGRLARGRRWFEYHCYEGEDSGDAELWHRTHQQVVVLRKLKVPEECDHENSPMYHVRFEDGFEYDIFGEELVSSPEEFERPDYKAEEAAE